MVLFANVSRYAGAVVFFIASTSFALAGGGANYVPLAGGACVVGDSRNDNAAGDAVPKDTTVVWDAIGGDLSDQGGDGCNSPIDGYQPTAALVTITAVGDAATGNKKGNLQASAAGVTPAGPTVLFNNANSSNTTIVALGQGPGSEGKISILVKKSDVPILVTLEGYFYPSSSPREVTVANDGSGDYREISGALLESDSWCPSPSVTSPCKIRVAPGVVLDQDIIRMKSGISIEGSGRYSTIVYSLFGFSPFITIADDVQFAEISNLHIVSFGNIVDESVGIEIQVGNQYHGVVLNDLEFQIVDGATRNVGIRITDGGLPGPEGPSVTNFIQISDVRIVGGAPGSVGLEIDTNPAWIQGLNIRDVNVSSFSGDGIGLSISKAGKLTLPIVDSTFEGGRSDVVVENGAEATLLNSYLINGTIEKNTGTLNCFNTFTPAGELSSTCDP